MQTFAFISRHAPTAEQIALAAEKDINITHIGDADAFTISSGWIDEQGAFDGIIVVHPAAALRLASTFLIGVFENGCRPGPDSKPQFFASSFHIFDLRG